MQSFLKMMKRIFNPTVHSEEVNFTAKCYNSYTLEVIKDTYPLFNMVIKDNSIIADCSYDTYALLVDDYITRSDVAIWINHKGERNGVTSSNNK